MDEEFEKDDLLEDEEYIDFLIESVENGESEDCSDEELLILNRMGY